MFKNGDKVRILKKSIGYSLDTTPFRVGDIGIYQHPLYNDRYHCIYQQKEKIRWSFANGDFELVQKFKIGDKVEILSKSTGHSIQYSKNKKGDIVIIDKIRERDFLNGEYEYSPNCGFDYYLEKDLRIVEEEMKMKYKFKKDLYVIDILNSSSPTIDEKRRFYNWVLEKNLDITKPIEMTNEFIEKFESSACFKDWLYEKEYLEEPKKEFESFTIPIEITSDRMYWVLWHRIISPGHYLKKYVELETKNKGKCDIENEDTYKLFNIIDPHKDKVDISKK